MTIQAQLESDYKAAMRAKDSERVACIRQLKSKIQEAVNAEGFDGRVDDALYRRVMGSYVKSLAKGIEEMSGADSANAAELRRKYQSEIDYLSAYLPKKLDEEATRQLVRTTVEALGASDPKQTGKVMGAIMKDHRDAVDAGMVKRIVSDVLNG